MTAPTLYKHKTSARAAAIKALGKGADFEVVATDDGHFYWIDSSPEAAEAAGMENDPPQAIVPPALDTGPFDDPMPDPPALPPTVSEAPVASETEPEPFAEPEEKANLTVDLGITPELAALIYGLGEAAGAAIPVPQKRKGITADAWAAAERGEMPGALSFPASNVYAQVHADNLRSLTEAGDKDALAAYPIGGSNTYSKALRSYRDALVAYLENKPKMKEAA